MNDKPICGAKLRGQDGVCQSTELYENGRCKSHGGPSTGPRTQAGKAKAAQNGVGKTTLTQTVSYGGGPSMSDAYTQQLKQQMATADAEHQKWGDALNRLIQYRDKPTPRRLVREIVQDAIEDALMSDQTFEAAQWEAAYDAVQHALGDAIQLVRTQCAQARHAVNDARQQLQTVEAAQASRRQLHTAQQQHERMRQMMSEGADDDEIQEATGLSMAAISAERQALRLKTNRQAAQRVKQITLMNRAQALAS